MKMLVRLLVILTSITLFSCVQLNNENSSKALENSPKYYISGSNSLPLFEGLNKINEESTNFNSVVGNISNSVYEGKVSLEAVENFYLKTLPQLGWDFDSKKENIFFYKRNKELLKMILIMKDNETIRVKFFIHLS